MRKYVTILLTIWLTVACGASKELDRPLTIDVTMPNDSTFQFVTIRMKGKKRGQSYHWARRENDTLIVAAALSGPSRLPPFDELERTLSLNEISEIYKQKRRGVLKGALYGLLTAAPMFLVGSTLVGIANRQNEIGYGILIGYPGYAMMLLSPIPFIDGIIVFNQSERNYLYKVSPKSN